jgi:hypothetical protein
VRSGDLNRVPVDVVDTEQWYLEHLVPQRVVMDATYLDNPTLAATLRVLIDTANHMISGATPRARAGGSPRGRSVR